MHREETRSPRSDVASLRRRVVFGPPLTFLAEEEGAEHGEGVDAAEGVADCDAHVGFLEA